MLPNARQELTRDPSDEFSAVAAHRYQALALVINA